MAHDPRIIAKRIEPIREYFTSDYQKRKNRSYLQACQAAESGLSGELGVDGCKVLHYPAYSIQAYPFSDYHGRHQDKLRFLLEASGAEGKKSMATEGTTKCS